MPEYAGISLSIQSQYDALTLPESNVDVNTSRPTLQALTLDRTPSPTLQHPDKTFATYQHNDPPIITAIIPTYPHSQFWITYACPAPEADELTRYYYLQLWVSGTCMLSWGVGARDWWRGRTVFGLFDGGRDFEGGRVVEKRGLFFPQAGAGVDGGFEVRVFRAKGRRREGFCLKGSEDAKASGGKVNFTSMGKVQRGERQRYFTYALIDAKDEPMVSFRYRFGNSGADDSLAELDITLSASGLDSTFFSTDFHELCETPILEEARELTIEHVDSSVWSNTLEQNTPPRPQAQPQSLPREEEAAVPKPRRLSFPPRNLLLPSTRRAEPSSPIKQIISASDDDLPRRMDEYHSRWMWESGGGSSRRRTGLRKAGSTPSPVKVGSGEVVRQEAMAPSHRKSGSGSGSGGLLRSVVASALRRKEGRGR